MSEVRNLYEIYCQLSCCVVLCWYSVMTALSPPQHSTICGNHRLHTNWLLNWRYFPNGKQYCHNVLSNGLRTGRISLGQVASQSKRRCVRCFQLRADTHLQLAGGRRRKTSASVSRHLNWSLRRRRRNSASVAQESESSERKTNTNKKLSVEFSSAAN